MTKKVTIVDYGIGNLRSVKQAFEHCGAEIEFVNSPNGIRRASYLVLPGVGAFADGMAGLKQRELIDPIKEYASGQKPFIGICLGMQMMLDYSEEFGVHQGLGLIRGKVIAVPRMAADGTFHKIPHIGWNELALPKLRQSWDGTILDGIQPGLAMYFVHSYMAVPDDPNHLLAVCDYGGHGIAAAIQKCSVYGTQFHPEKSAENGLAILRNFLKC